jgi:hypothetical protein
VSPDTTRIVPDAERTVTGAIAAATRRARMLGMVEAFGWGAVAAAISPLAGATVAVAVAAWRWRTTTRSSTVVRLERAYPEARNLFVTADELARHVLQAKPHARARVFADAARDVERLDLGAVFPIARLGWIALFAALSWGGVEIRHLSRHGSSRGGANVLSGGASPSSAPGGARLLVTAAIQPPAYTGLKETSAADPDQIQAIEGSVVSLSIEASSDRVSLEHDGRSRTLTRDAGGRFVDRWIHLEPRRSNCIWTAGLEPLDLPIAHGEGKFVLADESVRRALCRWKTDASANTYSAASRARDRKPAR